MDKPRNYDAVTPYGEFEPLELGGHICEIVRVEEVISRTGKEMINIYLDIAEGKQRGYYREQYENDTREPKKWGCIVYQLVHDLNGDTHRGFKTFNTAVEDSNEGFQILWGTGYCNSLKGKLIGGVFGREQYKKQDGELAWAVKCFNFRSIETIKKGVFVPKDRPFKEENSNNKNVYYKEEAVEDDDLPF